MSEVPGGGIRREGTLFDKRLGKGISVQYWFELQKWGGTLGD